MKILITGGAGFIGINVLNQLEGKHDVVVYDNLSMGKESDLEPFSVSLIKGDIKDYELLKDSMNGVDAVVHLAAHTRVVESIENPRVNFFDNVVGTFNVFEAARENNVNKIVFASTGGAIIGDVEPPVHEGLLPKPVSPYGASKLCCEAYASAYAGSYSINSIGLRFANVYGPYSYHKGSVVATFFKNIVKEESLKVFGEGNQTRDYVYSGDIALAIELALNSNIKGFENFHIGNGTETSINELIDQMRIVTNKDLTKIEYLPKRVGEIFKNYTLINKAKEQLNYEPKMPLEGGLKKTWEWFVNCYK